MRLRITRTSSRLRPSDHEPGGVRIGLMSQRAVFAALLLALGLVAGALFLLREGADTNGSRPGRSNPDGSVAAGPGGGAGAPDLLGSEEEDGATPGQRAARRPGRPGADGAGESAAVTPSE